MSTINPNQYEKIECSSLVNNTSNKLTKDQSIFINNLLNEGYTIISIQHTQSEDTRSRTHIVHIIHGILKQKELT